MQLPEPTILGLPGVLVSDASFNTATTWKVGGRISIPLELVFKQSQAACLICSGQLSLVAQVHTPTWTVVDQDMVS